jgi:hypothetical protein
MGLVYDYEKFMEEKNNKAKLDICPICGKTYLYALTVHYDKGKRWCEHDKIATENHQKNVNVDASKMAIEMATKQKEVDRQNGLDRMVAVRSEQKGKNFGQTEQIPERVIKSLEEKVAPILENLPE